MPRCRRLGKELTVSRFQHTDRRWGYSGTSDRIRLVKSSCISSIVPSMKIPSCSFFRCLRRGSRTLNIIQRRIILKYHFVAIIRHWCVVKTIILFIYSFSVDRRIFLIGYGVYGSAYGPAEYEVLIELIHTASGKIIATNATSFSCDGSNYTYRLTFKEPAEIIANTIYTASAKFKVCNAARAHTKVLLQENLRFFRSIS